MTTHTEPEQEVREKLASILPPEYNQAAMWNEDMHPFTKLDFPIVLARQEGGTSDNVIRRHNVTVYLFSKANYDLSDLLPTRDNAALCVRTLLTDYTTDSIIDIEPITDVNGPYQTGQNRVMYQFTVSCKSNFKRV